MPEFLERVRMCGRLRGMVPVVVNNWTDVGYGMRRTYAVVYWCREMETTKGWVYAVERHGK